MRMPKLLGVVAAGCLALGMGASTATALNPQPHHDHRAGVSQFGKVDNGTTQSADSKAKTEQKNFNVPIGLFEVGSNDGKVSQYNNGDTKSKADNWNDTGQDLSQDQFVKGRRGEDFTSHDCGCDGFDRYDNKDHGGSGGASQKGDVHNWTDQSADSKAETEQKNFNVPIGLFEVGSNDGKVSQYNNGDTKSKADNGNGTWQSLDQNQSVEPGHGGYEGHDSLQCGCINDKFDRPEKSDPSSASQYGDVANATTQDAHSKAETKQFNVNAPISIFSVGSNNGNVDQYNNAGTTSDASNGNQTKQSADQNQQAKDGNRGARQSGKVENSTDQSADSSAKTKQANVNVPISLFSVGSNNGDVQQGNDAQTSSSSSNWNDTGQSMSQSQLVG
jgi:hypothetical protein